MIKLTLTVAMIILGVSTFNIADRRIKDLAQTSDPLPIDLGPCHTENPETIKKMLEGLEDNCDEGVNNACNFRNIIVGCQEGNEADCEEWD